MVVPRSSPHEPHGNDASGRPPPGRAETSPNSNAVSAGALELAFERSEQGILLATDSGARWANPAAARLLGVDPRAACERPLAELLPELSVIGEGEIDIDRSGAHVTLRAVRDEPDATTIIYLTNAGPATGPAAGSRERSDGRYRAVLEQTSEGIFLSDPRSHRFLLVNDAACRITGYSRDELLAMGIDDLLDPFEVREAPGAFQRLAGGAVQCFDCKLRGKGGRSISVAVNVCLLEDGTEQAVVRDVTELRAALDTLRESEARFRQLTDHLSSVLWLAPADRSTVLYASPAFEHVFGWPADVMRDGLAALLRIVHPDDQERVRATFERWTEGPWEHEYRVVWPDGTVRLVCDRGFPVYDEGGRVYRYVGIAEDITESRARDEALRTSEAEMRGLLGAMTDLIFVVDREGKHLKVGPSSPELLYRPAEFVLGRTLPEIFPQQLADETLAAVRRALDEQRTVTIEYDLPIQGTQRWFSAMLSPMDANRVVWVARDVTERHAAERALRMSEERYRLLFESNPVPMMLFDEQTLAVIEVNDAAVMQYGWSREELARMTIEDIRPPSELEDLRRSFPSPPDGRRVPGRHWHWRKDGTVFPVEIAVHRLTIGGRVARLAMAQDVTERTRAERERQEAYDTLATLIDRSPLAIIGLDAELRVAIWNRAAERIFGYEREEVLGRPAPHVPDDRLDEHALLRAALGQGREGVTNLETQRRRKDGSLVDVMLSTATITGPDGRPSVIGFLSDISERRVLEAELRQAQKMEAVGRLAGGIAHDFNNILTVIVNYADLLLQEVGAEAPIRADLEEILGAGQRAARLTRQLLAFSRRQILQPQLIDVREIVDSMQAMLHRVIGEDIRLETIRAETGPLVRADPGQIEQVILNLAVNARDAMPTGGTLRFAVGSRRLSSHDVEHHPGAAAGDYLVLSATDTGHGMPPESVARIFEPFFTTKEVGKGTGLGLSTVYGVVQQSGGFITVESAVGVGTTFRIFLPQWTGDDSAVRDLSPEPEPLQATGRESILLVEDDAAVRAVARRVLEQHGYRVLEATNGRQALELLERGGAPVDLVLTDYVMPELGGRALVERLPALGLAPAILYMSGYADDAVLMRGDLPRAMGFVQKPFTGERLLAHVRQVLQAHRPRGDR
jgi:two-component system cell cycle sensor histidine kinase/response regulator CckA